MKLSSEEKKVLFYTLLILIVGYVIAYITANSMTFARTGSVVVCMGIYFGMKNYPGLIERFREFYEPIIDAQFTEIENQLIKDGIPKEKINKFKVDALVKFEKKVNPQFIAMKERFFRFEASILCLGTFIWGFGDLLVYVADKT